MALAKGMQSQLVCDFSRVHGIRQILLVGEHQQHGVTQLVLQREAVPIQIPRPSARVECHALYNSET